MLHSVQGMQESLEPGAVSCASDIIRCHPTFVLYQSVELRQCSYHAVYGVAVSILVCYISTLEEFLESQKEAQVHRSFRHVENHCVHKA